MRSLLEQHLAFARAVTPAGHVHALDLDEYDDPDVALYGLRRDLELLGIGGLPQLGDSQAEIKSMHTVSAARRQGIGQAILDHLLSEARSMGVLRVSLETGSFDAFAPARELYLRAGFIECGPFGDHVESPTSTFMTLEL